MHALILYERSAASNENSWQIKQGFRTKNLKGKKIFKKNI